MNEKLKYVLIMLMVIMAVFIGYKIVSAPYVMDDQQVLEKFRWALKSDNNEKASSHFFDKYLEIEGIEYHYQLDDDDDMHLKSSPFKGTDDLSDDVADYVLHNNDKHGHSQKILLERNN